MGAGFCPQKAFGRRLRQAKRSACPTRGWVKSSPEPVAADGPKRLSILRGFIFPAPSFVPYKTYETVPNLAQIRRKGQGLCPSCNRSAQRPVGGPVGVSRSHRSSAICCRFTLYSGLSILPPWDGSCSCRSGACFSNLSP